MSPPYRFALPFDAHRARSQVTIGVDISEWYTYDVQYWGIDYPPLTAYISYVFGRLAELLEPEMVALDHSRGFESPSSKLFMRLSVLVLDALLFMSAVYAIVRNDPDGRKDTAAKCALVIAQPLLLLIDHGHFQYNCVCLGLALWAVVAIGDNRPRAATVLFCLALNFKQIALYFAPTFFFALLARCATIGGRGGRLLLFSLVAITVASFGALWLPICATSPRGECATRLREVFGRIFPFERGLFEDKVCRQDEHRSFHSLACM